MNQLRQIQDSRQINFNKLWDYGSSKGIVPVSCIVGAELATAGLAAIRMQAFVTREALDATFATDLATFWSRSRQELWTKGSTSGDLLRVQGIYADCDYDSLIYDVTAAGPSCHLGLPSCFEREGIGE